MLSLMPCRVEPLFVHACTGAAAARVCVSRVTRDEDTELVEKEGKESSGRMYIVVHDFVEKRLFRQHPRILSGNLRVFDCDFKYKFPQLECCIAICTRVRYDIRIARLQLVRRHASSL